MARVIFVADDRMRPAVDQIRTFAEPQKRETGAPGYQIALTNRNGPIATSSYVGHYRSYIPWESNFRVVIRDGSLILIWPQGAEDELIPTYNGFRVGADPRIPERLWFDTILKGRALQARDSLSSVYHRFFPP